MAVAPLRRTPTASRVRAAALGLSLALLAALVAGCGGTASGGRPTADATDAGIRQALDRRAAAVLHHDRAAFLAGIDPRATRFLDRQKAMFTDIADVPLADWSYRLVRTGAFGLPPTADGTVRAAAEVQLRYRLSGFDAAPVAATDYLTLSRRGGSWYVAGDDDGAASGHRGAVQLWDQGRVTVVRGTDSLVLGLGDAAGLRGYAEDVDRAVPEVRRTWGGAGWSGKVVVEVPRTLDQMAALAAADPADYRNIAAVTTGEGGGSARVGSDRVIINPEAFSGLSAFGRQTVLTHETTHVATRAWTTARTPLWLSEGAADWTAYRTAGRTARELAPELAAAVAAGRVPAALPADADFHSADADTLSRAYEGGWLACRLIADQWSPDALVAFYRAVASGGTVDSHLRTTLGTTLPAFTARWRAYLHQELP
ncbi:hypothetical protein ACIOC1_08940 [Streptomyces sp. NPDC088197]|uniref:hypothetical protein n=1 Tax=Streptomyces sp. NPDC088197 TaxID=3365840 RepID=UPI0037F34457